MTYTTLRHRLSFDDVVHPRGILPEASFTAIARGNREAMLRSDVSAVVFTTGSSGNIISREQIVEAPDKGFGNRFSRSWILSGRFVIMRNN